MGILKIIWGFIKAHLVKVAITLGAITLLGGGCVIRTHNLAKKAQMKAEELANRMLTPEQLEDLSKTVQYVINDQGQVVDEKGTVIGVQASVEPTPTPIPTFDENLGIDSDTRSDGRVKLPDPTPTPSAEPVNDKVLINTDVLIYDSTAVPEKNVDGSSCKAYFKSVCLENFGSGWGTLEESDYNTETLYLVGVSQNPKDTVNGSLQSVGWLGSNLDKLKPNDAVKFTNLHVIGSLASDHVALLCSYDWYSAYGLKDTLVVFEDVSGTLNPSDFYDGSIFSATAFVHNMKRVRVKGQDVLLVQYLSFEA